MQWVHLYTFWLAKVFPNSEKEKQDIFVFFRARHLCLNSCSGDLTDGRDQTLLLNVNFETLRSMYWPLQITLQITSYK